MTADRFITVVIPSLQRDSGKPDNRPGLRKLKQCTWIAKAGVIERVFYPVFPPDHNAATVLAALREDAT